MNTKSVIIFILGAIIGLIFGKESDLSQEKLILCNFDNELVDWSVPSNKPSTIVFITNDSFETKNDNEMENYKLLVKQNCAKIWHLLENEEIFLGIGGEYYIYFPFIKSIQYIGISNHNSIISDANYNLQFYIRNYSNHLVNYNNLKTFPKLNINLNEITDENHILRNENNKLINDISKLKKEIESLKNDKKLLSMNLEKTKVNIELDNIVAKQVINTYFERYQLIE